MRPSLPACFSLLASQVEQNPVLTGPAAARFPLPVSCRAGDRATLGGRQPG
jgi:hypothetical protein